MKEYELLPIGFKIKYKWYPNNQVILIQDTVKLLLWIYGLCTDVTTPRQLSADQFLKRMFAFELHNIDLIFIIYK